MTPFKATDKWYKEAAESEEGYDISAGLELFDCEFSKVQKYGCSIGDEKAP
jgi:hypothetical protein